MTTWSRTCIVLELLLVHVDDVGAHAVHEVLRVGDQEEDALELLKRVLQPYAGLQVQVVRGLVQNEEHGVHKQSAGQRDAHSPPSAELPGLFRLHCPGKTQAVQDLCGTCLRRGGVQLIQPGHRANLHFLVGLDNVHDTVIQLVVPSFQIDVELHV